MVYVTGEVYQIEIPLGHALYCYSGHNEGDIAIRDRETGKAKIIKPFHANTEIYRSDHNTIDLWMFIHEIDDYEVRGRAENMFYEAYCSFFNKCFNHGEVFEHHDI